MDWARSVLRALCFSATRRNTLCIAFHTANQHPPHLAPCTLHLALCSPILHHQSHCNPNPQHLASAYSRSFCISLLQPRHHQQLVAGYSQLLVACSKYLTPLPTNSLPHLRFSSESFQSLSGVSSILLHPRPHVRGLPHRGLPPPIHHLPSTHLPTVAFNLLSCITTPLVCTPVTTHEYGLALPLRASLPHGRFVPPPLRYITAIFE